MINMLRRAAAPSICAAIISFAIAAPASAQQPTDAQRDAIRSSCRADYEANCASVPPGGMASLQCLQKNMPKLSSSCQQAVTAVEAPAAPAPKAESAPKTESAPKAEAAPASTTAPAAPKAAATPAAKKPTDAQVAAIRSSCRADYQKVCASVPPGGEASLNCLEKNKAKVSAPCQKSLAAVSGGAAPAAAAGSAPANAGAAAAVPAAPPPPPLVLRPMLPREELFVLRSACGIDVRTLCGGVAPGGGRIVQCLVARSASLSPACADVLAQFAAR